MNRRVLLNLITYPFEAAGKLPSGWRASLVAANAAALMNSRWPDVVKNMPREFKTSIGGKISQECVEKRNSRKGAHCSAETPSAVDLIRQH